MKLNIKSEEYRKKFSRTVLGLASVLLVLIIVLFSQGHGNYNEGFYNKYNVIYIGDNFSESDVKKVDKDKFVDGYKMKMPHYIFIDYEFIDDKDLNKSFLSDLVNDGHSIMYIGEELNPELVVEKFLEFGLVVVPLEAPMEVFYHLYGITYNDFDDIYIPLFYATLDENEVLDIDSVINEIHSLEEELDSLSAE